MTDGIDPDELRRMRASYASRIVRLANVDEPRIERAFATVAREAFLPPPPWTVISMGLRTQTSELSDIYENVLVAIARERGINNGEPSLHAAWMDALRPQPGERVIHVGAGTGYYTAILSRLVRPGGHIEAFEYESDLAAQALANLDDDPSVAVHAASAFGRVLPKADVIYVNAGVVAPDVEWLEALNPGGRLIFPWQPHREWGPAVLVQRQTRGFNARPLMLVGFIPCSGTTEKSFIESLPAQAGVASIRSIWIRGDRLPD